MTMGAPNSANAVRKTRSAPPRIEGSVTGTVTVQNTRQGLDPRPCAASSSD